MVAEARRAPLVVAFRREHLGGRLLKPKAIHGWVTALVESESNAANTKQPHRTIHWPDEREQLRWPIGEAAPVAVGGVLWALHCVVRALTFRYWWQPEEATAFVLSDTVPSYFAFVAEQKRHNRFPSLSRIVLNVDPSLSPAEVAAIYQGQRKIFAINQRYRGLDAKKLTIARFVVERIPLDHIYPEKIGRPYREIVIEWDTFVEKHHLDPTWKYWRRPKGRKPSSMPDSAWKTFAKHAKDALDRLLMHRYRTVFDWDEPDEVRLVSERPTADGRNS